MSHEITWKSVHDEREALLADLEQLSDAQWQTESLCPGWTVQNVVGHLVSSATTSKAAAAKAALKHKGDFQAAIDEGVAVNSAGTSQETLERFRQALHERTALFSTEATLGETVIHAEDIRRPLGIERDYPAETLRQLADHYKNTNMGSGSKNRIKGLHLMATDQEWGTGDGEVVSGPVLSLLMTMLGREAYLDDLGGEGLLTYRGHFTKRCALRDDAPG